MIPQLSIVATSKIKAALHTPGSVLTVIELLGPNGVLIQSTFSMLTRVPFCADPALSFATVPVPCSKL